MGLQTGPQDLVGIRDGAGNDLCGAADDQRGLVAQLRLPARPAGFRGGGGGRRGARDVRQPGVLERLVDGELHGAVADAETADAEAAVEAAPALAVADVLDAGPHAGVGAACAAVRRQHAGLEDPDGVCGEGGEEAGAEGGEEVVGGVEVGGVARAVRGEGRLEQGFEVEEERPRGGVAEEVGR